MQKKTRLATFTLIADILTAITIGFLTAFATMLLEGEWFIAFVCMALVMCNGFATIYFRLQI